MRREDHVRGSSATEFRGKRSGAAALETGAPYNAWQKLDASFQRKGVFVVPVGELESFCPSIGGKGPAWLTRALEDPSVDLTAAKAFVSTAIANTAEAEGHRVSASEQLNSREASLAVYARTEEGETPVQKSEAGWFRRLFCR